MKFGGIPEEEEEGHNSCYSPVLHMHTLFYKQVSHTPTSLEFIIIIIFIISIIIITLLLVSLSSSLLLLLLLLVVVLLVYVRVSVKTYETINVY